MGEKQTIERDGENLVDLGRTQARGFLRSDLLSAFRDSLDARQYNDCRELIDLLQMAQVI